MRELCVNCNSLDSEERCCFCHEHDRFAPNDETKIIMLEEEIEELKELHESDKESFRLIIDKANEKIEQLSNDNHVLKTAFITQQDKIEKMKVDILELKNTFNYFPINSAIDEILEKWS